MIYVEVMPKINVIIWFHSINVFFHWIIIENFVHAQNYDSGGLLFVQIEPY